MNFKGFIGKLMSSIKSALAQESKQQFKGAAPAPEFEPKKCKRLRIKRTSSRQQRTRRTRIAMQKRSRAINWGLK